VSPRPKNAGPYKLFIGVHATGLSYSDATREQHGDFQRLAFLSYDTLALKWYTDPDGLPITLFSAITKSVDEMRGKAGQRWDYDCCGHTALLGSKCTEANP